MLDVPAVMEALAAERPIFHSEADFQHAFAWHVQRLHPPARIRLETRPERGIHLDVLITIEGRRTAIELKYFAARYHATVQGETFDLPNRGAHDLSRHDFCKDIARVEALLRDGFADDGWAIALTNDPGYWRPGIKPDPIDACFRLHDGRQIGGELQWSALAGSGTTRKREVPIALAGTYRCQWQDYATIPSASGTATQLRYLALHVHAHALAVPTADRGDTYPGATTGGGAQDRAQS